MLVDRDREYLSSSFRDPSGFLFYHKGVLYRQIMDIYKDDYDLLMNSGLYDTLIREGLLIPHEEMAFDNLRYEGVYKIIKPEKIKFISYPYEWSFSQLRDAALCTLRIQEISLTYGMSLKDSSAYNIQFKDGKPVLIDTLSFERYSKDRPWVAYRQFCQHFLCPLALMSKKDVRLGRLLQFFIDGIPIDLASKLLPWKTYFRLSMLTHIHLHAISQKYFEARKMNMNNGSMRRISLLGLIDSLKSAVASLNWYPKQTEWVDYYKKESNYSPESFDYKKFLVRRYLDQMRPKTLWDLGANTGIFSRIAAEMEIETISFDIDAGCVEKNYLDCKNRGETRILPLLLDLTNPSPDLGWENKERFSIFKRGTPDLVLALALIHHLVISNNLPLEHLASFFSRICNSLIIEFVPKSDLQVQRLLNSRDDIFIDYTRQKFVETFERYFEILDENGIKDTGRILYLMRKKRSS